METGSTRVGWTKLELPSRPLSRGIDVPIWTTRPRWATSSLGRRFSVRTSLSPPCLWRFFGVESGLHADHRLVRHSVPRRNRVMSDVRNDAETVALSCGGLQARHPKVARARKRKPLGASARHDWALPSSRRRGTSRLIGAGLGRFAGPLRTMVRTSTRVLRKSFTDNGLRIGGGGNRIPSPPVS